MRIYLNMQQQKQLREHFDRIHAAYVSGSPGMLIAQIKRNNEGRCWIEPAFLDHETAKLVTEKGRAEIPGLVINSSTAMEPKPSTSLPEQPNGDHR